MKKLAILLLILSAALHAQEWPQVIEAINNNPSILTPIYGGASNINYKLALDGQNYFVRFSPDGQAIYLADASIEYEVLSRLEPLAVSPKAFYFDKEKKITVCEYLQESPEPVDLLDPKIRSSVITMLKKIEASGICIERTFMPYEHTMQLIGRTDPAYAQKFIDEFEPSLKKIDRLLANYPKKTLCHLDLHHQNLLKRDERLWIVDWEYAMMAHPYLVLASMSSIEHWDDEAIKTMLQDYVGAYSEEDFTIFYLNHVAIDLFWTAWNRLQGEISPIDFPYHARNSFYEQSAREKINSQYFRAL